ncbi:hypothetical protein [Aliivibrio salmonicida]|uniref:hypothetical protein n=1 Tax=Aliivibrio salmonicida TaxID=40269 RepID=UPI003D0D5484
MSEAIKAASHAKDYIEELIVEMLEGKHPNNEILLGVLELEGKPLQIQLKVTMNPSEFMDES